MVQVAILHIGVIGISAVRLHILSLTVFPEIIIVLPMHTDLKSLARIIVGEL